MKLTDALVNVREAAIDGRMLETWSENCYSAYGYNPERNRFRRRGKDFGGGWYPLEDDQVEFTINELLDIWHVREVKDE